LTIFNAIKPSPHCRAWRGAMLHSLAPEELVFHADGAFIVSAEGTVEYFGAWVDSPLAKNKEISDGCLLRQLPPTALLTPGMIDLHVHLPQTAVAGRPAPDLLTWLAKHIFSEESRFSEVAYARRASQWFFEQLLANGTTTAAVFLTSQPEAVDVAFEVAETLGNRVVMGQNLMDSHAPAVLLRPAAQLLKETEALCQRWHQRDNGRLRYAWMPRFALSCSDGLLAGTGELRRRYPDVYLHTHLSEQIGELSAVATRFREQSDYTAVYEHFGLLAPKTILAHGIHLNDDELTRLQAHDCSLAHCPGSNFFLKSGRFRWFEVLRRGLRFGLGSDVGAGPELSLFKAMHAAQAQQQEAWIDSAALFYAATLGGARALGQDDRIGNFESGKEADFLILDLAAKAATVRTLESLPENGEDWLARCIYLGDDRLVQATYVRGRQRYSL
jgi:guanine deaminase